MKYRPEFFQPQEFVCRCCGAGQPAALLVVFLELVRRVWDGPIIVNSGFRCGGHNRAVGGVPRSRHLIGCAADIRPADAVFIEPFKFLISHLTARLEGWEVKMYERFVHVGVPREEAARVWSGGLISLVVK